MSDTQAIVEQEITRQIWHDKYRYVLPDGTSLEKTPAETKKRMVDGVYAKDSSTGAKQEALYLCQNDLLLPGGRIAAGAGTPKRVTWINCFVSETIPDSMEGIMHALEGAALTQQQGGGIGMDFSTLRPKGAIVKKTGSVSTGPLRFMEMWNSMCQTVKSSGSRRGAMMGTMADWHPDLLDFIVAKKEEGRLTNFNVSVLVSDDLMHAVDRDEDWVMGFHVPPADPKDLLGTLEKDGQSWYVYRRMKARELWDLILKNTYDWAEPGVIFIDRINELNNLQYCETIRCTNPCGEQPLPPHGDCDLVHLNLAKMVKNPFTKDAVLDTEILSRTATAAVRFADNVLDTTGFPLPDQLAEAQAKRRIGIGYSGLGNALQMLRLRYGSPESLRTVALIGKTLRDSVYYASALLAKERGSFPKYDRNQYASRPFVKNLPEDIQDSIWKNGIRNGVLLTIAPVGTGSIYYGNISSGIEPTFDWQYDRKVRMPDGDFQTYTVEDHGFREYQKVFGKTLVQDLPEYMVTAEQILVKEHLAVQAEAQKYIDSSISKTLNCPKSMRYEDFKEVYRLAYDLGCKGCTTYRPSDVRGSVLVKKTVPQNPTIIPPQRPEVLEAQVYKIKMPGVEQAFYVTISDHVVEERRIPFEIFINSKSVKHQEWITALTRTISAVFRRGGDVTFLVEELCQVYDPTGGGWVNGQFVPSLVALIGKTIEKHLTKNGLMGEKPKSDPLTVQEVREERSGEICPRCQARTYRHQEGCGKCSSCGYSTCS